MADLIGVALTQESVQVVPGESATIGITVQNDSNVVDVLYIAVEGLDPSWYQLSVVQSSLFPGDQASGTLTLTPPKTSDAVAKSYPFTVKTTSQKDPTQSTSLAVDLAVLPFHSFEMILIPQKATGARGSYKLTLKNTGNADLNINLEGRDPEDLCRRARGYRLTLTGTPDPGTAEPASILAELDATARLPGIVGRIFSPFRRRPRAPHVTRPTSRLPRWARIAAGIAVAVVILLVVLVFALAGGGGDSYEVAFLINPDKTTTFGFDLPDADATRINAEAEWAKSKDALIVVIQRPDGSFSDPLPISKSGGSVTFLVGAAPSGQGLSGWAIGVTNTSASEQADGTLKITFSK